MQGASFAEVIEMTDIFEGSIIRLARRLDEFLNQVKLDASTYLFFWFMMLLVMFLLFFSFLLEIWDFSLVFL